MKKWILVVGFSACCVAVTALWKVDVVSDSRVIYIQGGDPVFADSVTQSDQFVFFEAAGQSGMFMKNDVTSVGTIQVSKQTTVLAIADQHKRRLLSGLGFNHPTIQAADSRLLVFLIILAAASALMQLSRVIIAVVRNQNAASSLAGPVRQPATDTIGAFSAKILETSDFRDIAMFFLELFKLQHGLKADAPARFSLTAASARRKMKVFELGVQGDGDWLTRRISVGPLGEETGSKSKCFFVIYDTPMVVKVPPLPVTDVTRYVTDIRRDVDIAAQLLPISCIVPRVSVVLKKIKKLPYAAGLTEDQLEKQYIRLIEDNPPYQRHLKIGDRFAFFMELTNSFFLGRVIDDLHRSKYRIGQEIREMSDLAWSQEAFTACYGLESLPVFERLQALYRVCEAEVGSIFKESGRTEKIHPFQIKNWFLAAIAGERLTKKETGLEATLLGRIETAFSTVFKSNQQTVDDLIRLLRGRLETKTFLKSRLQIQNIAASLLQLLCRLKDRRVALRDLKPDNLFLDADPNHFPVVLKNPAAFSMGVIDVETAVSLIPLQDGTIAQPVLGGTPLYATPLHLLENSTISAYFGSVADVLHLQDWHATTAILFKVMTGRNLFQRAARSFPEVLKILKSGRSKSSPGEAIVKAMSQHFWSAAVDDIQSHLSAYSDVLNQLALAVPAALIPSLGAELAREKACLQRAIGRHVTLCPLFRSEKNRRFLAEASSETIVQQIARWENGEWVKAHHRPMAPKMVGFLKNLHRLKQGLSEKNKAIAALAIPPHEVSAFALIEAMFQVVFRSFYRTRWGAGVASSGASDQQLAEEENRLLVTTLLSDR